MAEEQTTGTPKPEGGDAAVTQTTGTPGTDGRNADETKIEGTISKEEALGWKAKAERTNELEARLAAIEAERAQSPAAPKAGQDEGEEVDWGEIEEAAADRVDEYGRKVKGHSWAKGMLANRRENEELAAELQQRDKLEYDKRQLDGIAKEGTPLRKDIVDHYLRHRNRFGDPDAAYSDLLRSRQGKEIETLTEALKREQATRPNPNTPITHLREVTANENAKRMTRADWKAEEAAYDRREEQGDPTAARERMLFKRKRNNGEILVQD